MWNNLFFIFHKNGNVQKYLNKYVCYNTKCTLFQPFYASTLYLLILSGLSKHIQDISFLTGNTYIQDLIYFLVKTIF